ncbi:MAG TPA: translation initiation factor IF-2 associated domain-containing protein [Rhizomicrobium sp.]
MADPDKTSKHPSGAKALTLKKTETSTVKQSFSHGRTRAVVVEKKRTLGPLFEGTPRDGPFLEAEKRVEDAQKANATDLDLSIAGLTHIPSLSEMSGLVTLNLKDTKVSDLSPLTNLTRLQSLNLSKTSVADLSHVMSLTALQTLALQGTAIRKTSQLAKLRNLRHLDLERTSISSAVPIGNLDKLQTLAISNTNVRDLSPLAPLTSLIDAAEENPDLGLYFDGCPITNKHVLTFARLPNPERTAKVINYLREQQGMSHYPDQRAADPLPEAARQDSSDSQKSIPRPHLPTQGPGPQFGVRTDGIIHYNPTDILDGAGNDVTRLARLHRPLVNAIRELLETFTSGDINTYKHLFLQATAYSAIVSQPLDQVDFTLLYAAGLRLENARAAAEREIKNGIVPPLEDHQFESLKSVTTLHGVFISATAEGQSLLTDAERFDMTRQDVLETNKDIIEVVSPLALEGVIVERAAPQNILDVLTEDAPVRHPERRTGYSYAATSNLIIVLGGYAMIGHLMGGGDWLHAAEALVGAGTHSTLTKRGKDARHFAMLLASDGADLADAHIQEILRRGSAATRTFVLKYETPLRRLAARSPRFGFIADILDWLKAQH